MRAASGCLTRGLVILLLAGGCTKDHPSQPIANVPPKTFLWLFPDSTLAEGNSKQHIRWWGEDPDGIVEGYLLAWGKFIGSNGLLPAIDTIGWFWRRKKDQFWQFPFWLRGDT